MKPTLAIAWKETRLLGGFWIVMAATGLVLGLPPVMASFVPWKNPGQIADGSVSLIMCALYTLGCASTLYAAEREEGTREFLRALPARAVHIALGKLLFAVVSLCLLLAVLRLEGYCVARWWIGIEPDAEFVAHAWKLWALAMLQIVAWGLLFSLLVPRPIVAACFVTIVLICATGVVQAMMYEARPIEAQRMPSQAAWWYNFGLPMALIAIDVALALTWLRNSPLSSNRRGAALPATLLRMGGALGAPWRLLVNMLMRTRPPKPTPRFGTVLRRVFWHQARQLPWQSSVAALVIAAIVSFFDDTRGLIILMPAALLMGAGTFYEDQVGSLRYLGERGASGRAFWLARLITWSVPLVLGLVLVAVILASDHSEIGGVPRSIEWLVVLAVPLNCYLAGQLASMLARRGIMILALAVGIATLATIWAFTTWNMDLPVLYVPIVVALVVATRLRAPHKLVERNTLRSWLPTILVLGGTTATVLVLAPMIRVYQIPFVDPPPDVRRLAKKATPAALETARMYERAVHRMVYDSFSPQLRNVAPALNALRARVSTNRAAIDLALKAAARPEAALADVGDPLDKNAAWRQMNVLAGLVIDEGMVLQEEGRLDEALTRYVAALRIANHLRQRSFITIQMMATQIDASLFDHLVLWCNAPQQDAARLTKADAEIIALYLRVPPLAETVAMQYRAALRGAQNPVADWYPLGSSPAYACEAARSRRLLNFYALVAMHHVRRAQADLSLGRRVQLRPDDLRIDPWTDSRRRGRPAPPLMRYPGRPWAATTSLRSVAGAYTWATDLVDEYAWSETIHRATRILLAVQTHRLSKGGFPPTLESVGPLPNDPYSGRAFGYFPKGLPIAIEGLRDTSLRKIKLAPGTPFLWSAGHSVQPIEPFAGGKFDPNTKTPVTAIWGVDGQTVTASEIEIWSHGIVFPLVPHQAPATQFKPKRPTSAGPVQP